MDSSKSLKISRRKVLKIGAFVSAALAVGIYPGRIVKADSNLNAPQNPDQLGFMYNQQTCIGCKQCARACKKTNEWEKGAEWRRVLTGAEEEKFLSISCNHCSKPACMTVCPVKAYVKRESDGIVIHDREKCIGCKYCLYACPYHAPQFSEETGRVSKCHFCYERQEKGEKPACVAACPKKALTFDKLDNLQKTKDGVAQLDGLPTPDLTNPSWVIIPEA